MANCKYCGTWAGIFGSEHLDCAEMAGSGKTAAEIKEVQRAANAPAPARPLSAAGVFWAVFGALVLFSLVSGIVYAIAHAAD